MKRAMRDAVCSNLRSGKYEQGAAQALHAGVGWCCIGVLLDTVDPSRWDGEGRYVFGHLVCRDVIPGDLCEGYGLTAQQQDHLTMMNDGNNEGGYRSSFREIADWIEANVSVED